MNLLFTICARAGSKGVKSKNTREFCGQPLVYYTLASFQLFLEEYGGLYANVQLAINTDSLVLVEQINQTDTEYIYINREKELAGDTVSKISVIRDTLKKTENRTKIEYDIVVDLDITSPLRTEEDILGTLNEVLQDDKVDIAFSVTESRRSPYFNMVCQKEDGYYNTVIPSEFVARQQTPVCYDMNASIYAYKREYLLSGRTNNRIAAIWKMEDTAVLDIDNEKDYELLGLLAEYFVQKDKGIEKINHRVRMLRPLS